MRHRNWKRWAALWAAGVLLGGCGGDGGPSGEGGDVPFGETAIVTVVNPEPNDGNTAEVPGNLGADRNGIAVNADPGGSDMTGAEGLAVTSADVGMLDLVLGGGPSVPFEVVAEGDVYDLAVAYDGDTATAFANFPIRYAVGGEVVRFGADADPAEVDDAVDDRDTIVVLEDGRFEGDLKIEGDGVLLFGEGFTQRDVVIDGSIEVRGGDVRIRGFTITGDVMVFGNTFGMAYTVVQGRTQINGDGVAFLRNAFCGGVDVPSSSASLLDNRGLAPLPDPMPETCEPPMEE